MRSLNDIYLAAFDEIADLKWRIYNSSKHNKIITDDYGSLPCGVLPALDDAPVVSSAIKTTKKDRYVSVYVRF